MISGIGYPDILLFHQKKETYRAAVKISWDFYQRLTFLTVLHDCSP